MVFLFVISNLNPYQYSKKKNDIKFYELIIDMNMNNEYGRVLLTCIYDKLKQNGGKGLSRNPIYTVNEYNEMFDYFNRKGGICELVGTDDCQVKPYFDLDVKGDFDYKIVDEIRMKINEIIKKYNFTDEEKNENVQASRSDVLGDN